jgi:small subunit ribosomal protein S3
MGQKVHPHGFRVGVIKDWDSRWYARQDKVGDLIVEDYNIREYLKKLLFSAGIPKIEIERDSTKIRIFIHCSRPGVIIGKGGQEIEALRAKVAAKFGKTVETVVISIVEVKNADSNAQLVAESIAQRLEKRIGFRRAMKNAMQRAMKLGVRGIKVMVSGRLGGAEIARSEAYHEGTIPLQTLRADIDYGFAEAATTYGRIGVKVWIYNGEVLSQTLRTTPRTMDTSKPPRERSERRDNRDNRSGGNRSGGYNNNRSGGSSGGYQGGNRTGGSTTGSGQRTGYQGSNPRPAGTGYQGNNPRPATPRPAAPAAPVAPAPAAPAPSEGGNE